MLLLLFLFIALVAATTRVDVDKHLRLVISNDDANLVSQIDKVIVCSSSPSTAATSVQVARKLDTNKKCETDGFIQYEISTAKNNRIYHPHIGRVTDDHYYAQIHLRVYNKLTGVATNEVHIVRIEVTRQDVVSITLGCMTLAIVCIFAIILVARRKRQRPLFNKQSMDTMAADIGLYSTIQMTK